MLDTQVFSYQLILSSDIVKERNFGERPDVRIRRRSRLSVPKQSSDHDEVVVWVQNLVLADQPFIVSDS